MAENMENDAPEPISIDLQPVELSVEIPRFDVAIGEAVPTEGPQRLTRRSVDTGGQTAAPHAEGITGEVRGTLQPIGYGTAPYAGGQTVSAVPVDRSSEIDAPTPRRRKRTGATLQAATGSTEGTATPPQPVVMSMATGGESRATLNLTTGRREPTSAVDFVRVIGVPEDPPALLTDSDGRAELIRQLQDAFDELDVLPKSGILRELVEEFALPGLAIVIDSLRGADYLLDGGQTLRNWHRERLNVAHGYDFLERTSRFESLKSSSPRVLEILLHVSSLVRNGLDIGKAL